MPWYVLLVAVIALGCSPKAESPVPKTQAANSKPSPKLGSAGDLCDRERPCERRFFCAPVQSNPNSARQHPAPSPQEGEGEQAGKVEVVAAASPGEPPEERRCIARKPEGAPCESMGWQGECAEGLLCGAPADGPNHCYRDRR
jgi:hypothetical protein